MSADHEDDPLPLLVSLRMNHEAYCPPLLVLSSSDHGLLLIAAQSARIPSRALSERSKMIGRTFKLVLKTLPSSVGNGSSSYVLSFVE